jgi:hypothetical protein
LGSEDTIDTGYVINSVNIVFWTQSIWRDVINSVNIVF